MLLISPENFSSRKPIREKKTIRENRRLLQKQTRSCSTFLLFLFSRCGYSEPLATIAQTLTKIFLFSGWDLADSVNSKRGPRKQTHGILWRRQRCMQINVKEIKASLKILSLLIQNGVKFWQFWILAVLDICTGHMCLFSWSVSATLQPASQLARRKLTTKQLFFFGAAWINSGSAKRKWKDATATYHWITTNKLNIQSRTVQKQRKKLFFCFGAHVVGAKKKQWRKWRKLCNTLRQRLKAGSPWRRIGWASERFGAIPWIKLESCKLVLQWSQWSHFKWKYHQMQAK